MGGRGTAIWRAVEELLTAWRFTLVGVTAASIHVSVVWFLIARWDVDPMVANLVAFLFAFGFSFTGQYRWTFRSSHNWHNALTRFFVVALTALLINNIALFALLGLQVMRSSLAAMLAACIIPFFTYVASRFWAFR